MVTGGNNVTNCHVAQPAPRVATVPAPVILQVLPAAVVPVATPAVAVPAVAVTLTLTCLGATRIALAGLMDATRSAKVSDCGRH